MFKKLVAGALFAGFAAGLVAVLLQFVFVTPLLVQAELYETGTRTHIAVIGGQDHSGHSHDTNSGNHMPDVHASSASSDVDIRREVLTLLFTVFVYVGYGMLLCAGFAFAENLGHKISARTGVLWGMAGFVALQFAPSFGLALEMPGSAAADTVARQVWWLGTAVCTGVALWMFAYGRGPMQIALGLFALAIPHVIGAPQPDELFGPAPPELASLFASRALVTAMIVWSVLGLTAGYFWETNRTA